MLKMEIDQNMRNLMTPIKLNWLITDIYNIRIPGDGSCLFHAIMLATSEEYRKLLNSNLIERCKYVKLFRDVLANTLTELHSSNLTYYDYLGRGAYKIMSHGDMDIVVNDCSLETMQRTLRSNDSISYLYYELICEYLNIDIYLINIKDKELIITGDEDLLWKNRNSVILSYYPGHYELLGYINNNDPSKIQVLFEPTHPLILALKIRYNVLRNKRS